VLYFLGYEEKGESQLSFFPIEELLSMRKREEARVFSIRGKSKWYEGGRFQQREEKKGKKVLVEMG